MNSATIGGLTVTYKYKSENRHELPRLHFSWGTEGVGFRCTPEAVEAIAGAIEFGDVEVVPVNEALDIAVDCNEQGFSVQFGPQNDPTEIPCEDPEQLADSLREMAEAI